MALRYEWGWDVEALQLDGTAVGSLAVYGDDGTDNGLVTISSGTYAHTAIDSATGSGTFTKFDPAIEAAFTALSIGMNVIYSASTATYTLDLGAIGSLDFRDAATPNGVGSGSSAGKMMAALLGYNYQHDDATGGSASDPYNIRLSGQQSYASNCRPYCVILPTIQGRSEMSDEYEPEGVSRESVADDGTSYHVSVDGASIWYDWIQMAETDSPPATHSDDGMAVFKRNATAEVPWSYQHAWEHARTGGSLPFLVVDGSDSEVYRLRSDGLAFRPQRFASKDYSLWSIPFRARLLGRL